MWLKNPMPTTSTSFSLSIHPSILFSVTRSRMRYQRPVSKLTNLVVSFSDAPLRLALWAGLAISSLAILYGLWVIAMWTMNADFARGWSSLAVLVTFLGGANMLMTGVLGVYVGRIYAEVKRRPLYVVEREAGFAASADETAGRDAAAARRA